MALVGAVGGWAYDEWGASVWGVHRGCASRARMRRVKGGRAAAGMHGLHAWWECMLGGGGHGWGCAFGARRREWGCARIGACVGRALGRAVGRACEACKISGAPGVACIQSVHRWRAWGGAFNGGVHGRRCMGGARMGGRAWASVHGQRVCVGGRCIGALGGAWGALHRRRAWGRAWGTVHIGLCMDGMHGGAHASGS